jgi:glycosyltransferase involved in cell wall biosynthesis
VSAVSVIVPARDAAATISRTLRALQLQAGVEPFEVIVVDNGSRDETPEVAERAGARVLRRARGEGPGAARNAGVGLASGGILAFTDADCEPQPGWLAAGIAALESAGLVQGAVVPDPRVELGPFDRTVAVDRSSGLFEAASLFVDRAVFDRTGGFPPGLERDGEAPFGEDALFGWAARRSGVTVAFSAEAVVHHAVTRRPVRAFVEERTRLSLFPALIAEIPELRTGLCHRRIFLTRRTAAFDLALSATVVAGAWRRGLPLVLTLPYLATNGRDAAAWGPRLGARVVVGTLLADLVGACALVTGSIRSRTLVI